MWLDRKHIYCVIYILHVVVYCGVTTWHADALCADADQRKEKTTKKKNAYLSVDDGRVRACVRSDVLRAETD